jgi:clostripain
MKIYNTLELNLLYKTLKQIIILLLAAFLLFSGCSDENLINQEPFEKYPSDEPVKKWTFLMYMAGDNNLQSDLLTDLNEMERGLYNLRASSQPDFDDVRILVFFDGSSGDMALPRIYDVKPDNDMNSINSNMVALYDEMDTGNKDTLTFFLNKARDYYPSQNYFLIISSHGDGSRSITAPAKTTRAIAIDETSSKSWLYLGMISEAISTAIADGFNSGNKLAGIGMDACLMGTVEVAYQFRNLADYFVASMASENGAGWDYRLIFKDFNADALAETVASKIVENYYDYYGTSGDQTLSASNLNNIGALKTAIDALAEELQSDKTDFETTREKTVHFFKKNDNDSIAIPYYDLKYLCNQIEGSALFNTTQKTAALNVSNALNDVIVLAYAGSNYGHVSDGTKSVSHYLNGTSGGLSIFISRGNLTYLSKSHYAYQWWYTSDDTASTVFLSGGGTALYGHIDFANTNGVIPLSTIDTWKELFDAWY